MILLFILVFAIIIETKIKNRVDARVVKGGGL
jgi:hypothetical protein